MNFIKRTTMTAASPPFDLRKIRIAPLIESTALEDFDSGEREIDRAALGCFDYHVRYRRRVYCAHIGDDPSVVGFYCLGLSGTDANSIPNSLINKEGYFSPYMPLVYLHYLAVRKDLQRNGIGSILLGNFLDRCVDVMKNIGIYGVGLHALNVRLAEMYSRFRFHPVDENANRPFMVLPVQALIELDKIRAELQKA